MTTSHRTEDERQCERPLIQIDYFYLNAGSYRYLGGPDWNSAIEQCRPMIMCDST